MLLARSAGLPFYGAKTSVAVSMWMIVSLQLLLKLTNLLLELLHLFLNRFDALVVIWMMVTLFCISHGFLLSGLRLSDANRELRIFQCSARSSRERPSSHQDE